MGLSIRQYAVHRGCSHTAVRKALAAGRITALEDGSIDPAQADREWAAKTDPALQRGKHAQRQQAETAELTRRMQAREASPRQMGVLEQLEEELRAAGIDADDAAEAAAGGDSAAGLSFTVARTRKEIYQAKLLELKVAEAEGRLVDREKATVAVFDLARRERDAWLGWPARVGAILAGEMDVDPHRMEQALGRLVRDHMAELADLTVELR